MNPVNATSLYISASRLVLNYNPGDPQASAEICKMLPFFRQALACCVCGNLLEDPVAPTNSTCQHYVCKQCKGKKMMMKPSCSWCKDYEQFEENKQLSILVSCYKKLCEYITQTPLAQDILNTVECSADILAFLPEESAAGEEQGTTSEPHSPLCPSHSPLPPNSEQATEPDNNFCQIPRDKPDIETECSVANGLPACNGLSDLSVNIPSPESPSPMGLCCTTVDIKTEDLSETLETVCDPVSTSELCSAGLDICGYNDDLKSNDPLLLSMEEVLQSLETVSGTEVGDCDLHQSLETATSNGTFLDICPQPLTHTVLLSDNHVPSHEISCTAATLKVAKTNRKRSRSESDSEKVLPLPISSIILGPTLGSPAPMLLARENRNFLQPVVTVPNGGNTSKISKTILLSNKTLKKNTEHAPKKTHPKSKQTLVKTKEKVKEKIPSNNVVPGSPTKTVYKKPQEKKGCKCGRATQNPSVLTCRGQRCPCYSNRKACLDCICRGCQNSYMANGEKKLEAFAVPEKALEQTRLTLGINVTSIAVRNASTSASVLNVTGSPVATFLAASPHDDKSLDEAIDLRFDC
ncbi:E3 ubiquitin-protein ligase MSL2 [Spea bombifrons]|uniref:E3 ubiquitin-protein ligase MSL2 n=1 Tax=Spea bombifrons TaxID=233779 RepID=UPI00234B2F10|nr:E3 ubiquitin-protein ligase MSL2 [Spea bombifrons]